METVSSLLLIDLACMLFSVLGHVHPLFAHAYTFVISMEFSFDVLLLQWSEVLYDIYFTHFNSGILAFTLPVQSFQVLFGIFLALSLMDGYSMPFRSCHLPRKYHNWVLV